MSEPPQQTSFDVEELRPYSKLPPDDGPPHPISEAEPVHPTKETHFNCFYLGSRNFGHDPNLKFKKKQSYSLHYYIVKCVICFPPLSEGNPM